MSPEFWNQRYTENETVYGTAPNGFFKLFIDEHKPGTILLPAEGEGRNAIYAAKNGWQVDAFDFSRIAKEKALANAKAAKVEINYEIKTVEIFTATKQYDAVALIYVHVPALIRKGFHQEVFKSIKPGGFLLLEVFAKEQLALESGGPKDETLLYDAPALCEDFQFLHILKCEQKKIQLDEGNFHKGMAEVLRLTGQRI
jgi:SAM-dependent methyltransferase